MQADDVGVGKKFVKSNVVYAINVLFCPAICQYLTSECLENLCCSKSDVASSDNADCLSAKFGAKEIVAVSKLACVSIHLAEVAH